MREDSVNCSSVFSLAQRHVPRCMSPCGNYLPAYLSLCLSVSLVFLRPGVRGETIIYLFKCLVPLPPGYCGRRRLNFHLHIEFLSVLIVHELDIFLFIAPSFVLVQLLLYFYGNCFEKFSGSLSFTRPGSLIICRSRRGGFFSNCYAPPRIRALGSTDPKENIISLSMNCQPVDCVHL